MEESRRYAMKKTNAFLPLPPGSTVQYFLLQWLSHLFLKIPFYRSPGAGFFKMFSRPYIYSTFKKPAVLRLVKRPQNQYLHRSSPLGLPRRKDFFSSNAYLQQRQLRNGDSPAEMDPESQKQRRRSGRSPAATTSLRRVAVEAQRSRDGFLSKAQLKEQGIHQTKV